MRTNDLVKLSGLNRETLRYYEEKGLLPIPKRSESGYRNYTDDTLERIAFIKKAKSAGFTLREIQELIGLKTANVTCRTGRDIANQKISEIKRKQKALKEMQGILIRFVQACESEGEKGLNQTCHLSFSCSKPERRKNGKS